MHVDEWTVSIDVFIPLHHNSLATPQLMAVNIHFLFGDFNQGIGKDMKKLGCSLKEENCMQQASQVRCCWQ